MWQNMSILMVFSVINPGSISQSRSSMEETYAEVIIDDQTLHGIINFKNRHHETISHTTF